MEFLSIFLGAPSLWELGTSTPLLCLLLVMELGSVRWSGPDEIFLQRCCIAVGFSAWKGQYPECRSKAKCHLMHLRSHRAVSPSLEVSLVTISPKSSKKSAFRRNPPLGMLHFSCSWKSDSSFRWGWSFAGCKGAAILLYYQHVSLPSMSHGTSQGVAGQFFGPSHPALTLSHQSLWISAWCLFSGLLWLRPRAPHASMQKVVLSGFTLQIMQPFQTHLSSLMYSWQK